jgi:hypothetical protein
MSEHQHQLLEPVRQKLGDMREGVTWRLTIGRKETTDEIIEHTKEEDDVPTPSFVKTYVITGEYDDGCLGEIFIVPPGEGTLMRGLLDGFATMVSISLQYGVPLQVIIRKFINTRFGPSGMTNDAQVPFATSIFDLICRKLALRYLNAEALEELGVEDHKEKARQLEAPELCAEPRGEHDGQKHQEPQAEPIEEGWRRITQEVGSGRQITVLINERSSCFSGKRDPSDFAQTREGATEAAADKP